MNRNEPFIHYNILEDSFELTMEGSVFLLSLEEVSNLMKTATSALLISTDDMYKKLVRPYVETNQ